MSTRFLVLAAFLLSLPGIAISQTHPVQTESGASSSSTSDVPSFHRQPIRVSGLKAIPTDNDVQATMQRLPWDRGLFLGGGFSASGGRGDRFLHAGVRLGKVLTGPGGPGLMRGQFEYAAELMPYWQAFTPKETYEFEPDDDAPLQQVTAGGTYTGVSVTPILLRWNLVHWKRWMPWAQGGGGLIWTNHKFPPDGSQGTSVWNFTPQFGIGVHYFLKPNRSLTFAANAVHISSASLGDANPGVNATVQFQIGYTWWK